MKLRITISKYHFWYLCLISLQIILLSIQIQVNSLLKNFRIDRTFFSFLELDIQIIYYLSILIFKHFRILLVLWGHKREYSAPAIIIPIEFKRHSCVHLPAIRRFVYKGKIKRESRRAGKEQKKEEEGGGGGGPPDRRFKNLTDRRLKRSSTVDEAEPT